MSYEKQPAVYVMASRYRGTLYIGVTSDLWKRVVAHKNGTFGGFTSKYKITILVWYENHATMEVAIKRESQLKAWKRQWKIELVEKLNPHWFELHEKVQFKPFDSF